VAAVRAAADLAAVKDLDQSQALIVCF